MPLSNESLSPSRGRGGELEKSYHGEVAKGHFKHRDASLHAHHLNAHHVSITEHAQVFTNVTLSRILCENWEGGKCTSELMQYRIERTDGGA